MIDLTSFVEVLRLYRSAHLAKALEQISLITEQHPYVGLLKARLLSRAGQHDEAVEVLDEINPENDSVRLETAIVKVFPLLALQRYSDAEAALSHGRALLSLEHSNGLETEFHYVEAICRFMLSDDSAASRAANRALSASDDFFTLVQHPPLSASVLAHNRAKSLQILALVHSRQKQYHEQGRINRLAMIEMLNSPVVDAYTLAIMQMNLSYYVRDFDSRDDAMLLEIGRQPEELNWICAEVNRSLAHLSSVVGDFAEFTRRIGTATLLTPSTAYKVLLRTDTSVNNRYAFGILDRDEIERGFAELSTVTPQDQYYRDAVFFLAQELSFFDAEKSRELISRVPAEETLDGPLRLHDDREKADEAFARATIECNLGEDAVPRFFEAFETWNSVGYRKKAAMAAIELAELTHNPAFAAYARREAELRPGSWLDLRVRRMNV